MKTTRVWIFLLAVFFFLPTLGLAQSNVGPDHRQQEKIAHNYQRSLKKQQHKRKKQQTKELKAFRKHHRRQGDIGKPS